MTETTRGKGVVSFLDVLGWKDIWVNNDDSIKSLNDFILLFRAEADAIYRFIFNISEDADINLKINLFSDTIVVSTLDLDDFLKTVLFHAKMSQWALENGIKANLPLRGAIGYGDYSYSKTSTAMSGPVIAEISEWSEKANWIGVIFAPSVKFESMFRKINLFDSPLTYKLIVKYDEIPFKDGTGLNWCVRWGNPGARGLLLFIKNQKYVSPEISIKYLNTLRFLETLENPFSTQFYVADPSDSRFKSSNNINNENINNGKKFVLLEGAYFDFEIVDFFKPGYVSSIQIIKIFPNSVIIQKNTLKESWHSESAVYKEGDIVASISNYDIKLLGIFGMVKSLKSVELKMIYCNRDYTRDSELEMKYRDSEFFFKNL